MRGREVSGGEGEKERRKLERIVNESEQARGGEAPLI